MRCAVEEEMNGGLAGAGMKFDTEARGRGSEPTRD
jgi:hypothetical protein